MNKNRDAFLELIKEDKRVKIAFIIGAFGIILMLFSGNLFEHSDNSNIDYVKNYDMNEYCVNLEKELEETVSMIDGVGKCKVMITLENTQEKVYATDNESRDDNASFVNKDEYVIYDTGDSESPVLIKEYMPKVQGVSIVCNGGDNSYVREKVIETVTALFNIPANRVSVSKLK